MKKLSLLLLITALTVISAFGQSVITYQGQLKDTGGTVTNAAMPMTFQLYDALSGGNAIGALISGNVNVQNGLFTVQLDYSSAPYVFDGSPRWLEITVNGTALSPRQEITASPYSLFAYNVADGSITTSKLSAGAVTSSILDPTLFSSIQQFNDYSSLGVVGVTVVTPSQVDGVATDGTYAYVVSYAASKLYIYDITGNTPLLVSSITTGAGPRTVAYNNGYVYVGGSNARIQVFNVSNPAAPVVGITIAGYGNDMVIDGNYAYVLGSGGLSVYDVSTAATPVYQGQNTGVPGIALAVKNNKAFIVNNSSNALINMDVTNPANPTYLGFINTGNYPYDVATDGTYVYVARYNGGNVVIYNGSTSTFTFVASIPISLITPSTLALSGNILYVGTRLSGGLFRFDVTNPALPKLSDYCTVGDNFVANMTVQGDNLIAVGNTVISKITPHAKEITSPLVARAGLIVDNMNSSVGGLMNDIRFGYASGEGIGSRRGGTGNPFGIDIYTAFVKRLSITNSGLVGINIDSPSYALHVNGSVAGVGPYNNISDARYKKNIHTLNNALSSVNKLRGVSFDWNKNVPSNYAFDDKHQIGLIAQEVEKIIPEAVSTANNGDKSIAYSTLVPVLVEAIKQQQKQIDDQQKTIKLLNNRLNKLEKKKPKK